MKRSFSARFLQKTRQLVSYCLFAALLAGCTPALAVEQGFTVFHGSREKPRIALTVDDCYDAENVAAILELCRETRTPVTFFVIGQALKTKDAALWRSVAASGCEIGNHTWSHARLPSLNSRDIKRQLTKTQERLNEVLGFPYEMRVMRPPYGALSENPKNKSDIWVVEAIEAAGYVHAVRWDVSQTNPDKAIRDVENGSILLYHANKKDIRCLTQLIPALKAAGYQCVTVSELLGVDPAPEDTDWMVVDEELLASAASDFD